MPRPRPTTTAPAPDGGALTQACGGHVRLGLPLPAAGELASATHGVGAAILPAGALSHPDGRSVRLGSAAWDTFAEDFHHCYPAGRPAFSQTRTVSPRTASSRPSYDTMPRLGTNTLNLANVNSTDYLVLLRTAQSVY